MLRSIVPTYTPFRPLTRRISSRFSSASAVSICAMVRTASLAFAR
jgi:hypothetical protein